MLSPQRVLSEGKFLVKMAKKTGIEIGICQSQPGDMCSKNSWLIRSWKRSKAAIAPMRSRLVPCKNYAYRIRVRFVLFDAVARGMLATRY